MPVNQRTPSPKAAGGRLGGYARARKLSAKQLSAISLTANRARWETEEAHKAHSEALKASWARRRAAAAGSD